MKIIIRMIYIQKIEKYKGISEYEFYLLNLIGITKSGEKQSIFIKSIKQGKIKESIKNDINPQSTSFSCPFRHQEDHPSFWRGRGRPSFDDE